MEFLWVWFSQGRISMKAKSTTTAGTHSSFVVLILTARLFRRIGGSTALLRGCSVPDVVDQKREVPWPCPTSCGAPFPPH